MNETLVTKVLNVCQNRLYFNIAGTHMTANNDDIYYARVIQQRDASKLVCAEFFGV